MFVSLVFVTPLPLTPKDSEIMELSFVVQNRIPKIPKLIKQHFLSFDLLCVLEKARVLQKCLKVTIN